MRPANVTSAAGPEDRATGTAMIDHDDSVGSARVRLGGRLRRSGAGFAAAVGAAAASSDQTSDDSSSTQWGWIAFGILAAALVLGAIVWWWRSRRRESGETQ